MEYTQWECKAHIWQRAGGEVLILVVMEYTQWDSDSTEKRSG